MLSQPGRIDKLLSTITARVPLPPLVGVRCLHVPLQVVLVSKVFVTLVALEALGHGAALVTPLVVLKELEIAKSAWAESTDVRGHEAAGGGGRGGVVRGDVVIFAAATAMKVSS